MEVPSSPAPRTRMFVGVIFGGVIYEFPFFGCCFILLLFLG